MKNALLISVLALFLASCSADTEGLGLEENTTTVSADAPSAQRKAAQESLSGKTGPSGMCVITLSAHYEMDMSGGLNSPKVIFVMDTPLGVSPTRGFYARAEVQQMPDCEDYNYGIGPIYSFTSSLFYYHISANKPRITVAATEFPVCFRWRMVLTEANTNCTTYTPWYDAPVL